MPRGDVPVFITCDCGKQRRVRPSAKARGARFCSTACRSKAQTGPGNPKWRGGRFEDGHGRVMVYAPGDPHATMMGGTYAYEYRLVAAAKIGRPLSKNEIVHHVNGDHTDNRPENLEVMTQSQHLKEHGLHRSGVATRMARLRAGERVGSAKLTANDVRAIRASSARNCDLAKVYGVAECTISNARRGKDWGWVDASA